MSGFSAKISIWIKIFIFGLSLSSILIYVIMWRFHGAWIWSGLLIRKIYHGLSLYVWSWAKLYFINSWKKFKQQRSAQAIQGHIFSRSFPDLSSRFLSSQIPIQGVGPSFLEERRILMVHLSRISHPLWALSLFLVMILSYHCFQAHKSSWISLKGLEYSEGSFVCSDKTGLSGFKPDCLVFTGLTTRTELTSSHILSP
jgi:hypothetical protein